MNENRTLQPTPEQLIKLLDCRLELARKKRATNNSPRRTTFMVGGLLLIVVACCAALLVLQHMLSDLQNESMAADVHQSGIEEPREKSGKEGNAGTSTATSL